MFPARLRQDLRFKNEVAAGPEKSNPAEHANVDSVGWLEIFWFRYYRHYWAKKQKIRRFLRAYLEDYFAFMAGAGVLARGLFSGPEAERFGGGVLTAAVLFSFLALLSGFWKRHAERLNRKREEAFLIYVAQLQQDLESLILEHGTEKDDQRSLKAFIKNVIKFFYLTLEPGKGLGVNFMLFDPDKEVLRVHPGSRYGDGPSGDPAFEATPGNGAAGVCFQERMPVYIPSVRRRHGLILNIQSLNTGPPAFGVLKKAYEPLAKKQFEVFRSLLSVPVLPALGTGTPYGVLNFDSPVADPFDEIDFKMAVYFGQILGFAIAEVRDRQASRPGDGRDQSQPLPDSQQPRRP